MIQARWITAVTARQGRQEGKGAGHPQLHSKVEASLSYMRPYLRKQIKLQRKTRQKGLQGPWPYSQFPSSLNFTIFCKFFQRRPPQTKPSDLFSKMAAVIMCLCAISSIGRSLSLSLPSPPHVCVCLCVCLWEKDRVSLCSPGYPRTCSVAQASLPWIPICLLLSMSARVKGMHHYLPACSLSFNIIFWRQGLV